MIKLLAIAPMLCSDLHQTGEDITVYQFIGVLAVTRTIKSHRQYIQETLDVTYCVHQYMRYSFDLKTGQKAIRSHFS
jgi:hypothetical protein